MSTPSPATPRQLTRPQWLMLRTLGIVVDDEPYSVRYASPRQLAKLRWPDSPAWTRRTRQYGTNRNGAVGGTMPMKAATVLWRLHENGLVYVEENNQWRLTGAGAALLREHQEETP